MKLAGEFARRVTRYFTKFDKTAADGNWRFRSDTRGPIPLKARTLA